MKDRNSIPKESNDNNKGKIRAIFTIVETRGKNFCFFKC